MRARDSERPHSADGGTVASKKRRQSPCVAVVPGHMMLRRTDELEVLLRGNKTAIDRAAPASRIAARELIFCLDPSLGPISVSRLGARLMKTKMNIVVRGLFATPVAAVQVPGAAERNAALTAIILRKRNETPSVQASNAGGWHSDREILSWAGNPVVEIVEFAKEIANRLTADRQGKPSPQPWKVMAWANVNGPGDANICHYHPGAFWSGTYYVEDGGCATDPTLGGEFEMLDPRGAGPGMYAPALQFVGEDGASVGAAETIRPRPGLLFMFPSWLFHQVRPYRGAALRISIAFNLSL